LVSGSGGGEHISHQRLSEVFRCRLIKVSA